MNRTWFQSLTASVSLMCLIAASSAQGQAPGCDTIVSGWGDDSYGQASIPVGVKGALAISAGLYHTAALKSNRTVEVWGDNTYGQTAVPAGLTGVTAIAAGGWHTVALKSDGTVVAWGGNAYGESNTQSS